jgi:hypothetical protein
MVRQTPMRATEPKTPGEPKPLRGLFVPWEINNLYVASIPRIGSLCKPQFENSGVRWKIGVLRKCRKIGHYRRFLRFLRGVRHLLTGFRQLLSGFPEQLRRYLVDFRWWAFGRFRRCFRGRFRCRRRSFERLTGRNCRLWILTRRFRRY